jgi:hypothetical protein
MFCQTWNKNDFRNMISIIRIRRIRRRRRMMMMGKRSKITGACNENGCKMQEDQEGYIQSETNQPQ